VSVLPDTEERQYWPPGLTRRGPVDADSLLLILALIVLVVPLGLDTFAVSAAIGAASPRPRERLHVALTLAAFEAAMPLFGLAVGVPLGAAVGHAAEYAAGAVLIVFGAYQLFADEGDEQQRVRSLSRARGWALVLLGLAVSIDELAVGFTLGLLRVPVIPMILAIGLQALILSQVGLRVGTRLGDRMREGAERISGLALIGIGAVIVIQQL
jgi:manganese efflux pump family protein